MDFDGPFGFDTPGRSPSTPGPLEPVDFEGPLGFRDPGFPDSPPGQPHASGAGPSAFGQPSPPYGGWGLTPEAAHHPAGPRLPDDAHATGRPALHLPGDAPGAGRGPASGHHPDPAPAPGTNHAPGLDGPAGGPGSGVVPDHGPGSPHDPDPHGAGPEDRGDPHPDAGDDRGPGSDHDGPEDGRDRDVDTDGPGDRDPDTGTEQPHAETPQERHAAVRELGFDETGDLLGVEDSPGVRLVSEEQLLQVRAELHERLGPPTIRSTPKGDIENWTISTDPRSTVTFRPFSRSGGATIDFNNIDGLDMKRLHIPQGGD
jgi:hypothetical protein